MKQYTKVPLLENNAGCAVNEKYLKLFVLMCCVIICTHMVTADFACTVLYCFMCYRSTLQLIARLVSC